jgi:hypothetical protein
MGKTDSLLHSITANEMRNVLTYMYVHMYVYVFQ